LLRLSACSCAIFVTGHKAGEWVTEWMDEWINK
jgi:hypothetical protein